MAVGETLDSSLTHRHRGQARSHKGNAFIQKIFGKTLIQSGIRADQIG